MQMIDNWLKGNKNYHVGLAIFNSFSSNKQLKELLATGNTPYNHKRLCEELTSLSKKQVVTPKISLEQKETAVLPDSNNKVLQALKNKWQPLYQKMNMLRHNLDATAGDNTATTIEERKKIATEILTLEKECNKIWSDVDYYNEHGKLPEEKDNEWPVPTDPLKLANAINNCKKAIRNNRKKMQENPTKPKYAKLYEDYKQYHVKLTGNEYNEN
jgi:hypothetical protein